MNATADHSASCRTALVTGLCPVLRGGNAGGALENAAEISGIAKAAALGNLYDGEIGGTQQVLRFVNFDVADILNR